MDAPAHSQTLTRDERLHGKRRVDGLFETGKAGFQYPFRYVWQVEGSDTAEAAPVSVLVTAPKRNHKRANRRNTLKRRTREAYRLNKGPLVDSALAHGSRLSLALIYSSREIEEYKTIEDAVRKIISRIASGL